jgi:hypothetical protein
MTKRLWFLPEASAPMTRGAAKILSFVDYLERGMTRIGIVMVRCPATGRDLSTGVEMDAATFERLPEIRSRMKCPACGIDHTLSTHEAWLGNPAPSLPELPWLLINNRNVAND